MSHYEIQTYKPFPFSANDRLDDRFASFKTKFGGIGIEWNTYDNRPEINKPPYKLTFRIENTSQFDYVSLEQVEIISSAGNDYAILPNYQQPAHQNKKIYGERSYSLPLKFNATHKYKTLEPAFQFDFLKGEKIKTRIVLKSKLKTGEIVEDILMIDWHPITADAFAPLV